MRKIRQISLLFFLIFSVLLINPISNVNGQSEPPDDTRGIDMMLVIDNSCSMFSDEIARQSGVCSEGGGNDVDYLRIIGSEIFFDSLGLGNLILEDRDQIGVISFGGDSRLIHSLSPIRDTRNTLTAQVQNPTPQPWTDIGQALASAYEELESGGLPNNAPAIVLITDGKPEISNQPYDMAIIASLLEQHPDVPVFIMLVQNNENLSVDYADYVAFWQQADAQNSHIFHYVIEDQEQIDDTYQDILTQLADEIPVWTRTLQPNEPYRFYVNEFVQALRITVIHDSPTNKGNITITDPDGNIVQPQPGNDVRVSEKDDIGRVDVIYIGEGYLNDDYKDDYWTIESDATVEITYIPTGAYRVNFVQPDVSYTQVSNVYDTVFPHPASKPLTIKFNLLRKDTDLPVESRQDIYGYIINPDGSEMDLPIPTDLFPDGDGYYELPSYQFPVTDDNGLTSYQIVLHAGVADEQTSQRVPIAKANLFVQVGRFPSLGEVSPSTLTCNGGTAEVSVTIDDYDYADPRSVQVYVEDMRLEQNKANSAVFTGDVSDLCMLLLTNLQCSTSDSVVMTARLSAYTQNGVPAPVSQKDIHVQTLAPTCTPTNTPSPTPTLTPTPTPTPIPPPPDQDNDGGPDAIDVCTTLPGIPGLKYCPTWILIPIAFFAIILGFLLIKYIIPHIWVRTPWGKPPTGYIRICNKDDKAPPRDLGMYDKGMQYSSSKITIGGDRKKSHIYVKNLEQPVEFMVEKEGDDVVIRNVVSNKRKVFKENIAEQISSKNGKVTIYFGLDVQKVQKKKCS